MHRSKWYHGQKREPCEGMGVEEGETGNKPGGFREGKANTFFSYHWLGSEGLEEKKTEALSQVVT